VYQTRKDSERKCDFKVAFAVIVQIENRDAEMLTRRLLKKTYSPSISVSY
jgi:hypothetical protein